MMTTGTSHNLGSVSQIPLGEGRNFLVAGTRIAVFHTHNGEVFATQPDCPHRQGPLADGLIGDEMVICPLHDRMFNLRTGEEVGSACRLITYPAALSGEGAIIIQL